MNKKIIFGINSYKKKHLDDVTFRVRKVKFQTQNFRYKIRAEKNA